MPKMGETLFEESSMSTLSLPANYEPVRPEGLHVAQIVLAKGSRITQERRSFIERIRTLYPSASVVEHPEVPHNRINLGEGNPAALHEKGKQTLVFGELKNAVRMSEEVGNTCPNYWHFSVYGYCFFGCTYCYLAGTRGVWNSPTVKIYVNLQEILAQIDSIANRCAAPIAFYHGKLQDGLALDPLTAYATTLVPFFARHAFARQVILTKSNAIDRLLNLDHRGHTVISWSLNPPEIANRFEKNVPPVSARIEAMRKVAEAGYPVRAVIMPLIPVPEWEQVYGLFLQDLLLRVPIQRLTFGGICSYRNAQRLMEHRLGQGNTISRHIAKHDALAVDGRSRYRQKLRIAMYIHLARIAKKAKPDLEVALCLESPEVWNSVNKEEHLGRCNCIL